MIDQVVSHYKILERLGGGGMGVVYRAEDLRLKRHVALKFLPREVSDHETARQRFLQEARTVSALDHPNVCTLHEVDETEDGRLFLAMAFYRGETLDRVLKARGTLPPEEAADVAAQVAKGLARAHRAGVVHRDVKPANLMLLEDGLVKVLDFGIAKLADGLNLTREGTALGTAAYMSPEQGRGRTVDHRADLWSLGVVLYEMISGRLPFRGEGDVATLYAVLHNDPEPLTPFLGSSWRSLEDVVARALVKEPEARYASAEEMARDLAELSEDRAPATVVLRPLPPPRSRPRPSVAVLPFKDLSRERDQEYFCVGLAEELIDALAGVPGLRVASRSSAARLAADSTDLPTLAGELGIGAVLEGSVRKSGNRARITVQLTNVEDGYTLWSNRYDRELEDIFRIQEEIASQIVDNLELTLVGDTGGARGAYRGERAPSVAAYNLYLKGRYYCAKRTEEGLERGIGLFREALAEEPGYARAHAGLADAYSLLGIYGARPPREVMPAAKRSALAAIEHDERLAEAHASLGCVGSVYDWEWRAAEASYRRSLELDPRHADVRHGYAVHRLLPVGRFAEASEQLSMAQELDPLSPVINTSLGLPLFFERRFDEAIAAYRRALDLEANFGLAHFFLGQAYCAVGDGRRAVAELERSIELSGPSTEKLAALAHAHGSTDRREEASRLLQRLRTARTGRSSAAGGEDVAVTSGSGATRRGYVSPVLLAQVLLGLGHREEALAELERALAERAADLVWLGVRPVFDPLREEPRLRAILGELGLEEREDLSTTLSEPWH